MSLIGIDVGSSAVKVGVYRPDGTVLRHTRTPLVARHDQPGWWELEPSDVWDAVWDGLRDAATDDAVRRDPPAALAIVTSGREAFPVSADGTPLGRCLMAGDRRLVEVPPDLANADDLAGWVDRCGHAPTPSDPLLRLRWWQQSRPDAMDQARWFLDWHGYLTLKLDGQPVTDHSLAAGWLCYDRRRGGWSNTLIAALETAPVQLPEIAAAGTVVGQLAPSLAAQLGWSPQLPIIAGAFDAAAAAIGSGAGINIATLACGSWETVIQPVRQPTLPTELASRGDLLTPYPGSPPWALYSPQPQGGAAVEWVRRLLHLDHADLQALVSGRAEPSSAVLRRSLIDGYHSGSPAGSALKGLSLSTGSAEIVQAVLESIAYELVEGMASLTRMTGRPIAVRATGGGAANSWWMQLKADLTGLPIEVTSPAATSLGAGLLAGLGADCYASLDEAADAAVSVIRRFEPDSKRAARHAERLTEHRAAATGQAAEPWRFPAGHRR